MGSLGRSLCRGLSLPHVGDSSLHTSERLYFADSFLRTFTGAVTDVREQAGSRGVAQDAPFFTAARLERRAGALTQTAVSYEGTLVRAIRSINRPDSENRVNMRLL